MRLLATIAGLAISFAFPTFAQEQNAVDPEVRQQIEAALTSFDDAFNKQDAAALAALFTLDATQVNAAGVGDALRSGQEAIKKWYEVELASGSVVSGRILPIKQTPAGN